MSEAPIDYAILLNEFGNTIFSLTAIFIIAWRIRWAINSPHDKLIMTITLAWAITDVAVLINKGWWALAVHLGPSTTAACLNAPEVQMCKYDEWMWSNSYVQTVLSSLLYLSGSIMLLTIIENWRTEKVAWVSAIVIFIAALIVI